MELLHAFSYSFKDEQWLGKLGEIALFSVLCVTPVIGLIPLCALLGYLTEIIHNVLNDNPRPLPVWDHIGEDVNRGVHVLFAIIVYHLPLAIVLLLLNVYRSSIGTSVFGGNTFAGIVSGLLPLLLVYLLFAWSMFTLGLIRYAETWESSEFYQFNTILRVMHNNALPTVQWLIASFVANIVLILLAPIALLGVVLFFPVHGYLIGRYGRNLRAAKVAYRRSAV